MRHWVLGWPGQASLVSPVEASVRPSARLLAQSSSETNSEASPPPLVPASDERIRELTLRVEEINDRLRALNTDWSMGSVVMVYMKRRGDAALHRWRPDMPARSVVTASFSF